MLVASAILGLVMAVVIPQVVLSLRTTGVTRDISQSKGVAQAQLEEIRNLPFYVGRAAGDYIDVLDTYYRDTTPPSVTPACTGTLSALPATNWTGYVGPTSSRCPWEPPGAFYRKVINPISAPGLGVFAASVSTQFLDAATPPNPLAPVSGYNSQNPQRDSPTSNQVGVTVTVFYRAMAKIRYVTTYSQVDRGVPSKPRLQLSAKATALSLSSATSTGTGISLNAGVINLAGEVYTGSRTITTAAALLGTTTAGQSAPGAVINLSAPIDRAPVSVPASPNQFTNGCTWVCFGITNILNASAYSSNGIINAGSSTNPVRAEIPDGATRSGFTFSNGSSGTRMRLLSGQPIVSMDTGTPGSMLGVNNCEVTNVGTPTRQSYLASTGFLRTTNSAANVSSRACVTTQANTIKIMPTDFAPNGVVQVVLTRAAADCGASLNSGAWAATGTASFEAVVRYWRNNRYQEAGIISSQNTTDPLADVSLNTNTNPSGSLRLSDYIASWSSLTRNQTTAAGGAREAEVSVPGVINIITQPTREGVLSGLGVNLIDPASAISINVGALSCKVVDSR